jgi:hypothetical protein
MQRIGFERYCRMLVSGIGVDVGGVVIRAEHYHEDATVSGPVLGADSDVAGARDGLRTLVSRFDGRVFLISKCGPLTEARMNKWLEAHGLLAATGLSAANIRFCRSRSEKAPICAELGLTHMVDDRVEILNSMANVVEHRFLFCPDEGEVRAHGGIPDQVNVSASWAELVEQVRATLR